ncbi:MAG: adenine deaminase [Cellulosilyticaceae bacterium]
MSKLMSNHLNICRKLNKADKVLKNASIINVFSKEIIKGDIAIANGKVIGIGKYEGIEEIDLKGKYVAPGFIDSHVHIESTMVSPREFASVVMPFGTTTIIADPHEIANVAGLKGVEYMIRESEHACIHIYYMLPSCVPCSNMETSGAILDAEKLQSMIDDPKILGLGEVMNYPGVILGDTGVLDKLEISQGKVIDGHAPGLGGYDLMAYVLAGIQTDHECSTLEETLERIRLGMIVQIRKGSAADNLEDIVKGMIKAGYSFERCVFCTDDKHLDHIMENGHINSNIRESIALGVDPIEAIAMATLYPAKFYGLNKKGAIAPGYDADLVVFDSLEKIDVESVMIDGMWKCREGVPTETLKTRHNRYSAGLEILNTVNCEDVTEEDLRIDLIHPLATVMGLMPKQIITRKLREDVPVVDGTFVANEIYSKIVVVERYQASGNIGKGIVKGFDIKGGAIAQTIAHDSHNIICIGDNDRDMVLAINYIKEKQGGIVVVKNGVVIGELHLPLGGLMSTLSAKEVTGQLNKLITIAYGLGINKEVDPFLTLAFLALPVIPEIKITDKGLFDVGQFKHISIN